MAPYLVPCALLASYNSASAFERFDAIALAEQGFSQILDQNRAPLDVPFTWIEHVCLIGSNGKALESAKNYLELVASTVQCEFLVNSIESARLCSPDTDFMILISDSHSSLAAEAEQALKIWMPIDDGSFSIENFPEGFAYVDPGVFAISGAVWENTRSDMVNLSGVVQEIYQAISGGQDVIWQGEFSSILHEVVDPTAPTDEVRFDEQWHFRNSYGMCALDVFMLVALRDYAWMFDGLLTLDRPTSRGFINFVYDSFDQLDVKARKAMSAWHGSPYVDARCI